MNRHNKMKMQGWLPADLIVALSGCAVPDPRPVVAVDVKREVARVQMAARRDAVVVRSMNAPYMGAKPVEYAEPRDEISLQLDKAPLVSALEAIAKPKGYAIVKVRDVKEALVNVAIFNLDFDAAIREIAAAAGVAVVFDHRRKAIYIANEATYTYRIPSQLFEDLNMTYNVASNPSAGGGQGAQGATAPGGSGAPGGYPPAGGAPGGGTGGGVSANNTNMRVSGGSGSSLASFREALRATAGDVSVVSIMPETGMVTVRGNGSALRRVTEFLNAYTRNAGRQIEVKAALVEVTLTDEMAYGIDWTRVLNSATNRGSISISTAGVVSAPVLAATITRRSITSVIKALDSSARVKVVAEPQLWMTNHQPGIVYNATQRPYLGSVTQNVAGNANIVTTTGTVSYVTDGVSLAFKPNILDDTRAELTVIPMLTNATNQQIFRPGNGLELTAYDLPTTSTHMKLLLETGKTYIVGGNRLTTQNQSQAGIPGVRETPIIGKLLSGNDDRKSTKELVLMLSTNIVPAPQINVIVGESL